MKKNNILMSLLLLVAVLSCTATGKVGHERGRHRGKGKKTVGIANPASEYCVKQGGESHMRKHSDGSQYGMCRFKDGTEIEEWEYYRHHN